MASQGPTVEELMATVNSQRVEIEKLRAENEELREDYNKLLDLNQMDREKNALDRAAYERTLTLLEGSELSLKRTVLEKNKLQEALNRTMQEKNALQGGARAMDAALFQLSVRHGKTVTAHQQLCEKTGTPFVDEST